MKAALDVHYESDRAAAACVAFRDWGEGTPAQLLRVELPPARAYHAGRFYERELPALLAVLEAAEQQFETILIDGFVHLKPEVGKGLGTHLYEALPYPTKIIGVAKKELVVAEQYTPITRGRSRKPLYISAIGCPLEVASGWIAGMHGPHRLPTLLKIADRHARGML